MRLQMSGAVAVWACLAAVTATAQADDLRRALGTYERKGDYWQQVIIKSGKVPGRLRASFEVSTRGCIGEVVMDGVRASPNRLLFSKLTDHPDGQKMCNINVTSSDNFKAIKVVHEYCYGFYGAACDFNGSLKRSR